MTQTFFIGARLPGLNELIELRAKSPHAYNKTKQKYGSIVAMFARQGELKPTKVPVKFWFHFVEPDARRDPDNFCSAGMKMCLDAIKKLGLIPDDSQKWVKGIALSWSVGDRVGIRVTMEDA